MSSLLATIIIVATLGTAFLSSIFGMVGGLILMGILASILPVPQAMVLHGIIQLTSNGYRAYLNKSDICWPVLGGFIIGGVLSMGLLTLIIYTPDKIMVMFILGALPFIAAAVPKRMALDITKPYMSFVAGFIVVLTNLLAGIGGPLLDIFFQRTPLTRHQVVATKAIGQSIGHSSKIIFYGGLAFSNLPHPGFILICLAFSVLGTTLGKRILDRMEDQQFFKWTNRIVLTVGAFFLLRAIALSMGQA